MNRAEFESTYLNKQVEITLFDGEVVRGKLEKSSYTNYRMPKANWYSVENSAWFKKSHIKKIKILSD